MQYVKFCGVFGSGWGRNSSGWIQYHNETTQVSDLEVKYKCTIV